MPDESWWFIIDTFSIVFNVLSSHIFTFPCCLSWVARIDSGERENSWKFPYSKCGDTPKNRKRQKGSKRAVRSLHALHTCHTRTVSTVYTRSSCAAYLQILQSTGPTGDGACLAKGKQYSLLLSFWPKCEKAEMSRRIRPKGVLIYYYIIIIIILYYIIL
jgi:hypothetical protein